MAETPESFAAFIEQYPDYLGLHAFVEALAHEQPELFSTPPDENIIDGIATALAGKVYLAAYLSGGLRFMYEVMQEFKRLEKYEEAEEVMQMLKKHAPYVE